MTPDSRRIPDSIGHFNGLFTNYRRSALRERRAFTLSRHEFLFLATSPCVYCGSPPREVSVYDNGRPIGLRANGVDRVDNHLGYVHTNVVPACSTCNLAKHKQPVGQFLAWIRRIANTSLQAQVSALSAFGVVLTLDGDIQKPGPILREAA